jgi:hypothetical protein
MKKQGQLVTLPSIPTASDAFAPPKLRHPSTYSPTEPVMFVTASPGNHPPHCWLPLPKNNVILSALQLNHRFEHCDHQLCELDPSLLAHKFRTESLNDVAQIIQKDVHNNMKEFLFSLLGIVPDPRFDVK